MQIKVIHAEIHDTEGDALLVPTDANVKGHYGRTCRAALALSGKEEAPHGFGNGRAVLEHATGPFAHLVFMGTIADTQQRGDLASAFAAALDLAIKRGCRQIVTPLLTGGWRIPPVDAVTEMLNVVEKPWYQQQRVELTIVEQDEERVAIIQGCLEARGYA